MNNLDNENAACYFLDRHLNSPVASKVAFIESDGQARSITYEDLAQESGKLAELLENHGIEKGDRVALLLLDTIDFPIVFWGSIKAGIQPVAVNTLLATDVYKVILEDCEAKALFVSAALLPVVETLLPNHPTIQSVFVVSGDAGKHLSFTAELSSCTQRPTINADQDDCAFWLYSSGSTGQPKGVRHKHSSMQDTADSYGQQVLEIQADDTVYSAAKFFFAYGLGNSMSFPMAVGATAVLLSGRPTPDAVLDILNSHNINIFFGVPTLYAATVAHLDSNQAVCEAKLRRCVSAGEALPAEIGRQWQKITDCEILDGVGSTEMLHIFLSNQSSDVVYGTSGTAVPGYEVRLVDEQNQDVAVGEIGELLVHGGSSAIDYWNQPEKSLITFESGWTRTGDKYEQREDGRFIYCGRTDDMFKVSGIWVSPFEVEQAIISHPLVLEAAVVPARDDQDLEKPKAFIVLKNPDNGHDLNETLKEHVKEQIGKWKYPRWIEVVSDLPKTATGKIQRFKLRS